jgi:hypothetical protein
MVNELSEIPFHPDAVWVGSDHPFDLHEAYLCFRSPLDWVAPAGFQQAELWITADSRYKLWVNGQFVARGPARSFPEHQAVDRIDLTPHLHTGPNSLAVMVYQPGYSHFAYLHRGACGLLAQLVCDECPVLVTGPDWRVRRDRSFAELVPRVSIYGSGIEERDLNLVEPWTSLAYNASSWARARVVAPLGRSPWTGLQLRRLPLLAERAQPLRLVEARHGPYPVQYHSDPHLALRAGWGSAQAAAPEADVDGWYKPVLADHQSSYYLFDLGRDYTCLGWSEIVGAGGQEWLSISYAEKFRGGQLVISDPETYCRVRLTDRFRLGPGHQRAEPFAVRGGRYLLFQLTGPTGPTFRIRFHARVTEYPLDTDRQLTFTDPQLAGVSRLCETTFRACLQDGFVDSTWRESSQWLGDALPQSLIMAALSDDTRPLRRVIELAAQGAYPDGVLPSVLPGEVHAYTIVDYNFSWVELLSHYWRLTGNGLLVEEMWPVLVKMLDRFHQDLSPEGLLLSQPGRRLFLDWAPVSRNEPNAIYNFRYLLALQLAVQLAQQRGLTTAADSWRQRASSLQAGMRRVFWRDQRWYDDSDGSTFSQLAASLAILTRSTPDANLETQLEQIAARSLDPNDEPASGKMVLASPFMHHYIFEALRSHRKFEATIEIIRRRWGRWVTEGYPTTWENWSVDFPDGSQCHAFSAHPLYHLAEMAGELEDL